MVNFNLDELAMILKWGKVARKELPHFSEDEEKLLRDISEYVGTWVRYEESIERDN